MYLATSPNGQQYISTSSLDNCKTYASKKMVCTNLVVYDSITRPICELQILHIISTSLPKTCVTTTFTASINTFQNIDNNKWLYIVTNETQCVLQCSNEVSQYKLQGVGLLTLPKNCKLFTGYSTLTAFQTSEENVTYPIIMPDIRMEDCFEYTSNIKAPDLIPIAFNELPLDSLKQIRHQLDLHKEEIKKLTTKPFIEKHHHTFFFIQFTIGMILLTYLIYKCCHYYPNGLNRRRCSFTRENSCVQIFNNCFDNFSRRRTTQVAIPMREIQTTSCISDDEEETNSPSSPSQTQRSGINARSLF
ncbi:unnamed protein product [Diatraea saccharalis]|uniref:Envelope protein n=1 Tax=Diatraea saccharalis TaxID=40085 RepID=A0A9N9N0A2_9NEOP|nr:unnamed protein product [Diatraea saccharalis]